MHLDRRLLLQFGAFGAGALAIPGAASAIAARGFSHGVASGEPSQDSVLLWTRYVSESETSLDVEISENGAFNRVGTAATTTASPERDHTATVIVKGLQPGRWYFYRFRAPNGEASAIGRTRTLPDGQLRRFTLGVFSCSNLPFGWFNAYAHAAARGDLDLIVHLGDYLYEYRRGVYPSGAQALPGRLIDPAGEIIQLVDYRLRYAAYRSDPDLQRLHQLFPMIAMWDDHESANNSWTGGAENHQPATEGEWQARKAAAIRAYREWMPVSDNDFAEYRIGELATLFRPETRLSGRSRELLLSATIGGLADLKAALASFRDGPWQDPSRTMMGLAQEQTLAGAMRRSTSDGVKWQILAQQVVMAPLFHPPEALEWIGADANEAAKKRAELRILASSLGLPQSFDTWDGFPAARDRVLRSAQDADANLIVLTGDTHNCWAFDLERQGKAAGVEFAGQSVTSPGYETSVRISPRTVEQQMMRRNPNLKWANFDRRGYLTVELTPSAATAEWQLLDTVRTRSTAIAGTHRMRVQHGRNRLS